MCPRFTCVFCAGNKRNCIVQRKPKTDKYDCFLFSTHSKLYLALSLSTSIYTYICRYYSQHINVLLLYFLVMVNFKGTHQYIEH